MRREESCLKDLVNNYQNFTYIILHDIRLPGIDIERASYKNIYIYYINRVDYDFIFLYNKSNKFYRLMMRKDRSSKIFTLINDFYDNKVKDYFLFSEFLYLPRESAEIDKSDIELIEILKKIDL